MGAALKRWLIGLVLALGLAASSAAPAVAQETATESEEEINVACVASDIGTIGGVISAVVPGGQALAPILGGLGTIGQAAGGGDCALGEGILSLGGAAKDAVKDKLYDSTLGAFIESLLVANGQVLKTIFSWWIAVPTVDLEGMGALEGASPEQLLDLAGEAGQAYADATGEENPAAALDGLEGIAEEDVPKVGNGGDLSGLENPVAEGDSGLLQQVNDFTGGLQIWLLMLGLLLGLVRIGWAHQQAQGQESLALAKGITRAVLIAMGFSVFVTLATRFSDAISVWWMGEMVQPEELANFAERIVMLSTTPLSGALVFLVGLLGLIAAIVQVVVIIIRNALLVVVVAVMPLAAAASLTRAGNSSVEKMMGWTVALILFKPVAALVYSIAIMMVGDSEGPWEIITGMALLSMAVLTLPALLSMVAPATQAVGGGASGMGVAAGIAGGVATGAALAATGGMASGAMAAKGAAGSGGGIGQLAQSTSRSAPTGAGGLGSGLGGGAVSGGPSGGGAPGGGDLGGGGLATAVGTGGDGVGPAAAPADSGELAGVGAPASASGGNSPTGSDGSTAGGPPPAAASPSGGSGGIETPAPSGGGAADSIPPGGDTGAASMPAPSGGGASGGTTIMPAPSGGGASGGGGGGSALRPQQSRPTAPLPRTGAAAPRPGGSAQVAQQAAGGVQRAIRSTEKSVNNNSGGDFPRPSGG